MNNKPDFYEIGREFYLIRTPEADLHRNIYLKRFIGSGTKVNMLFDPGTKLDTPLLTTALGKLIGGIQNVDLVFLSHQDPDVASNVQVILANSPQAIVVSSVDTLRLIKMLGLPERNLYAVEAASSRVLALAKTGHRIQFVPAYFCHFRGAMMLYDFESNVLFSGDFLAGVNTRKESGIYADESSFQGISLFHQIYMPSNQALRLTVDRITMLNPAPSVIAPQHGDVVAGKYIDDFLARISQLDVGIELIQRQKPIKELVISALNNLLEFLEANHPQIHTNLLTSMLRPEGFTTLFQIEKNFIVDIKTEIGEVVSFIWKQLEQVVTGESLTQIRTKFVEILDNFGIALPQNIFGYGDTPRIWARGSE